MVVNADKPGVTCTFGDNRTITSVGRFVRANKNSRADQSTWRRQFRSRPVWKPTRLQVLYVSGRRCGGYVAGDLFTRGISMPSSSSHSEAEELHLINEVRRAARALTFY